MNSGILVIDAFWSSNKPFPTALKENTIDGIAFYNNYHGTARYLGWMDLILLKDFIQQQDIEHIILKNLDTLGKIAKITKNIQICSAYTYNNFVIRSLAPGVKLSNCRPIYKTIQIGGWDSYDNELHVRAQHYMQYLLMHTQVQSITNETSKKKFVVRFDDAGKVIFETLPHS